MLEEDIFTGHYNDEIVINTKTKAFWITCIENDVPKYFAKYRN